MAITYTATSNPGGLTGTALDGLPIEVTGLTLDTPYTFTVTATADIASTPSTPSASVTPAVYVGKMWSWGSNDIGHLGLGDITYRSSPVQVGVGTNWNKVSGGFWHGLATKTDGTLWAWGYNQFGQLGMGNTVYKSAPTQVGAGTNWSNISGGVVHTAAIKKDGTLWTWGSGRFGILGNGSTADLLSLNQIGAASTWLKVSCGHYTTHAIKTDGTLWGFGRGVYGALGDGTTINRSSPVQIGVLTNWSSISSSSAWGTMGIANGALWALGGQNSSGELGINNKLITSNPTQVGALTTWLNVSIGYLATLATKTDGTLWTWGSNAYGQLGLDLSTTATYRSSPVQVGTGTTWLNVSVGHKHVVATKTDGTLWSWGYNAFGQLGQGDLVARSSPVQVGALTHWSKKLTSEYYGCIVIST